MVGAAALIMALGLLPAFQPGPTPVPRPLLWETPQSWTAPTPEKPRLHLSPSQIETVRTVQNIRQQQGPEAAAAHLAKTTELELLLFRAGLRQQAGDLRGAQADYEKVLDSKNRTAPRALALSGYKNVLRQRIDRGEKELYGRLIKCLKEEWRNEEALSLLPSVLADPGTPTQVRDFVGKQEPIMALRLGRYDRAAELWANPAGRSEQQWLAQTEQRRGNFVRAAELRLRLALQGTGQARLKELTTAWEILARGGLLTEALKLADQYPELKKAGDYNWRMGLAALAAGETGPAESFFEELLKNPKHPRRHGARYFLARTLSRAGRAPEAGQIYAELIDGPFNYYQILARGQLAGPGTRDLALAGPMLTLLETGPSGRDRDSLGYHLWITEKALGPAGLEAAAADLAGRETVLAGASKALNEELSRLLKNRQWSELFDFLRRHETAARTAAPAARASWPLLAPTVAAWGGDYRLAVSFLSRLPSPDPKRLPAWSHPLVYSREVKAACREYGLPPSLLLALIRTESAYQADVMSASNARGLMQLLPATANKVAARLGQEEPGSLALFDPELNIRYGSWYLAALIEGFGHEALALAGYNGGPYNIKSLIAAKKGMPLDVFIESLTFEETTKYVKRITESRYIYEAAYLGRASLPDLTGAVTTPRASLPDF